MLLKLISKVVKEIKSISKKLDLNINLKNPEHIKVRTLNWAKKQSILSAFCIALSLIYGIAFLAFLTQFNALLGDQGLLPASSFLDNLRARDLGFFDNPTLFWVSCNSISLFLIGSLGLILSISCLSGRQNALVWFGIWVCYISIVHIGQVFYGYGWESLLLETGFFTIFLCPLKQFKIPKQKISTNIVSILIIWILFRNMFGAGLIKLRGDAVWRDYTALFYHFETQPIPNPLSWFFHHLPKVVLKSGVVFNHIAEIILPIFLFFPFFFRRIAAFGIILFQFSLILSGNLSWLNYVTIVQCLPAFQSNLFDIKHIAKSIKIMKPFSFIQWIEKSPVFLISFFTLFMSIYPIHNMLSPSQKMNASFNRFHLVNTYGAFGHVGKTRYELVVMGTSDKVITEETIWEEYLFKGKPNRPSDSLPIIAPFHYRLDWQIWFAAMRPQISDPWLVHFVYKLLINDKKTTRLLKHNPFPGESPNFIKVDRYIYEFDENRFSTGAIWVRRYVGSYCPPVKKDYPSLKAYLERFGWL